MNEAFKEALIRAANESQSPLAQEVIRSSEEQKRFEEAKQASKMIGQNYYLLRLVPIAPRFSSLSPETLHRKWQGLREKLPTFPVEEQTEIIKQMVSGMNITEKGYDPRFKEVLGTNPRNKDCDYLAYSLVLIWNYSQEQTSQFYDFWTARTNFYGTQMPVLHKAIVDWLRLHPQ